MRFRAISNPRLLLSVMQKPIDWDMTSKTLKGSLPRKKTQMKKNDIMLVTGVALVALLLGGIKGVLLAGLGYAAAQGFDAIKKKFGG